MVGFVYKNKIHVLRFLNRLKLALFYVCENLGSIENTYEHFMWELRIHWEYLRTLMAQSLFMYVVYLNETMLTLNPKSTL